MKNLKKFVALLLAGVMAMVMLTACSGGGGGTVTDEQKQERAYNRIAKNRQVNAVTVTENDKDLQKIAKKYLHKDLDTSVEILGAKLVGKVHVEGEDKEYLTVIVTGRYDYGIILSAILTEIQNGIGKEIPGTNVNVKGDGTWTKLGVIVESDGNRSYMAFAFKVKNPNKK